MLTHNSSVPPNCAFEVDDIEEDWTYKSKFDLIFLRMMTGSLSDWPRCFKQCYEYVASPPSPSISSDLKTATSTPVAGSKSTTWNSRLKTTTSLFLQVWHLLHFDRDSQTPLTKFSHQTAPWNNGPTSSSKQQRTSAVHSTAQKTTNNNSSTPVSKT